jgi:hypothetical protein
LADPENQTLHRLRELRQEFKDFRKEFGEFRASTVSDLMSLLVCSPAKAYLDVSPPPMSTKGCDPWKGA